MRKTLRRIAAVITVAFGLGFSYFAAVATVTRHNADTVSWAIDCLFIAFVAFMWLVLGNDNQYPVANRQ